MRHAHLNDLGRDLQKLLISAEELLQATVDATGDALDTARARTKKSLHTVRERLAEADREVTNHVRSADEYVHEHPWQSIAAAGAFAFLLGLLAGRR